ncbi:hypothetical protein F3Y22_tig00111582pilonHSYRG00125 [Hibiscus syriacus]|uniref:Uncharacterized protein n=1 Tax=Hibiscus syriacus TaxID=106335 RepID=A0A6A2Y5Y5_HIBSY|nr:hypothetical protein F3Y22_tig00111582pilonHSYRG00125 [Hibiscus syriacus]
MSFAISKLDKENHHRRLHCHRHPVPLGSLAVSSNPIRCRPSAFPTHGRLSFGPAVQSPASLFNPSWVTTVTVSPSVDSLEKPTKLKVVAIFVVGFWILDVANNMLKSPFRALLADLSANDHKKMRTANGWFSFFMAVGNAIAR